MAGMLPLAERFDPRFGRTLSPVDVGRLPDELSQGAQCHAVQEDLRHFIGEQLCTTASRCKAAQIPVLLLHSCRPARRCLAFPD